MRCTLVGAEESEYAGHLDQVHLAAASSMTVVPAEAGKEMTTSCTLTCVERLNEGNNFV